LKNNLTIAGLVILLLTITVGCQAIDINELSPQSASIQESPVASVMPTQSAPDASLVTITEIPLSTPISKEQPLAIPSTDNILSAAPTPTTITPPATSIGSLLDPEPQIGSPAPDFTLKTLDGSQIKLSDLRGQTILLSYWATWCIPCLEELPALNGLQEEYRDRGLVILTINSIEQDRMDKVQALVSELGLSLPILLDEGNAVYDRYQILFFPSSFIIGPDGIIQEIILGSKTEDVLRQKLDAILAAQ
jgi:peroxiredoxin